MTQYTSILSVTLALNVLALAYRCQWYRCITKNIFSLFQKAVDNNANSSSSPLSSSSLTSSQNNNNDDNSGDHGMNRRHSILLYRIFLPVYLLATAADWLQGPYKYAVYSAYGYTQRDISILFVAGFGSGMSLGSIVGGMADTYGRKRMACVYCITYTFSCLAKHFRPFWILLVGRVLGGIATSLLFSVFDAWLIRAHAIRNIDKSYLSESFSAANFGSSIIAILAGLLANSVVGTSADAGSNSTLRPAFYAAAKKWFWQEAAIGGEDSIGPPTDVNDTRWDVAWVYKGGGIAAFDLALIPLGLCCLLALAFWDENYGDNYSAYYHGHGKNHAHKQKRMGMLDGLRGASITIWRSTAIFGLCAVTSFFEGAMYVFILLWTPALRALDVHPEEEDYPGPPLGIVFATFMVCCMLGTSIFSILSARGIQPARILVFVLALSSLSCLIIATTSSDTLSYMAMLLFEGCIGAYYPAMSTVKGSIVPEDQRAAIYSVFRLPMNLVVLINLFSNLGFKPAFGLCFAMLALATMLQMRVVKFEAGSNSQVVVASKNHPETQNLLTSTIETTSTTSESYDDDNNHHHDDQEKKGDRSV